MRQLSVLAVVVAIGSLAGCSTHTSRPNSPQAARTMVAVFTPTPVQIDGQLDEAVWQEAPAYRTNLSKDFTAQGEQLQESGEAKVAWDNKYLYVALKFIDSDIVAQGTGDQQPHFQMGDVGELFLKPQNSTWYWELYVTPAGKKTRYWFPGCGWLGLGTELNHPSGLVVAAKVQGTLNDWKDRDTCWTAEMAVPIADLTVLGDKFGPDSSWRILVGRYNYSRYLARPGPEISETPQVHTTSFHLVGEYAWLVLRKQP